ncbi:MAG: tetratricopeptide repeat protein [Candidatus Pacebacteria bacterium]|nr:tetratricopeptide repeat protein [Candidatus Paceibacterota bacterium]
MKKVIIFVIGFSLFGWGEVIILKNDSVYTGKIKEETEERVIIKTEIGDIGIPRDIIREIKYDWVKEGEEKYKKGNWQEAIELFEKYLEKEKGITKTREEILYKTGICYVKTGQEEKGKEKMEQLLKEYPETIYRDKAELEIGKIYYEKGEKEKAKGILSKIKARDKEVRGEAEYYLFLISPPEKQQEKEKFYDNYISQYPESNKMPEILYLKAEALYNKIENKEEYTTKNIPQYKQIKELLEKASKTGEIETLKKIYPLLITCYDHIAEYQEKYKTMKQYAELLYPEDKEKQAEYLKQQADKLMAQEETGEAIIMYRFIIARYPNTKCTRKTYLNIAEIFRDEGDIKGAINEYKKLLDNYPKSKEAEIVPFEIIKMGEEPEKLLK